MRATKDRIRHAISFEVIALLIVAPAGAWAFDKPLQDIGVVGIVSATTATLWNYLYNLLFDHAMLRIAGHLRKTLAVRVLHTLLFEGGLLVALLPFIAWYLDIGLLEAFYLDVSFTLFYLVYAFVFNWLYDLVFPIPNVDGPAAPESR